MNALATSLPFSGATYSTKFDSARLTGQLLRIYTLMIDGEFRTYREIAESTGDGEASISAQLRNLRKPGFGSHVVEKRARGDRSCGLFEYAVRVQGSAN